MIESSISFETADRISVTYTPAGLGSRFISFLLDSILLTIVNLVILFVVLLSLWTPDIPRMSGEDGMRRVAVLIGFYYLINAFITFTYFFLSEWFMDGRTFGKSRCQIRVVSLDGHAPTVGALFLRNVFRVVDNIPLTWVVPMVTRNSQRFGDLVAGTIVIAESDTELSEVRKHLSQRQASDVNFRFDAARLRRLTPEEFSKIEQILDRIEQVPGHLQQDLLRQSTRGLSERLEVEPPTEENMRRFLEDLLHAEYQRRTRQLG